MRKRLKITAALLLRMLLATGVTGCGGETPSAPKDPPAGETPAEDETPSQPTVTYNKLFDFEGEDPLRGCEWYTVTTAYHTRMEEIYEEVDGNHCMKITAVGAWAGFEFGKDNQNMIPVGATTNKLRVRVTSATDIPALKFSVKIAYNQWAYATTDILSGEREYVLEFEEAFYQFRGFTLVAKDELYDEIYIDDIYVVVEI